MAPPLYFFAGRARNDLVDPGTRRFRAAPLASAGLDEVWRDVVDVDEQCSIQDLTGKGPGGKSGLLVVVLPPSRRAPKRLGFFPEFQRWQQADDNLWLGVDKEEPPGPEDLLRESRRFHHGYRMQLADGQEWTVPIIRRPPIATGRGYKSTELPEDIGWDQARNFVKTLKAEYRRLWDDTAELCDLFYGDEAGKLRQISVEDGLRWAIRLLALNYRYGIHEQNLLHVVDADGVFPILGAAVDFVLVKGLLDAEKKSAGPAESEASSTAPGSPDCSPGTGPAEESSS